MNLTCPFTLYTSSTVVATESVKTNHANWSRLSWSPFHPPSSITTTRSPDSLINPRNVTEPCTAATQSPPARSLPIQLQRAPSQRDLQANNFSNNFYPRTSGHTMHALASSACVLKMPCNWGFYCCCACCCTGCCLIYDDFSENLKLIRGQWRYNDAPTRCPIHT